MFLVFQCVSRAADVGPGEEGLLPGSALPAVLPRRPWEHHLLLPQNISQVNSETCCPHVPIPWTKPGPVNRLSNAITEISNATLMGHWHDPRATVVEMCCIEKSSSCIKPLAVTPGDEHKLLQLHFISLKLCHLPYNCISSVWFCL